MIIRGRRGERQCLEKLTDNSRSTKDTKGSQRMVKKGLQPNMKVEGVLHSGNENSEKIMFDRKRKAFCPGAVEDGKSPSMKRKQNVAASPRILRKSVEVPEVRPQSANMPTVGDGADGDEQKELKESVMNFFDEDEVPVMRNIIGTIIMHPQLLCTPDFKPLADFIREKLHVRLVCDNTDIEIPVETSNYRSVAPVMHPPRTDSSSVPFLLAFGFIKELTVSKEKGVAVIKAFHLLPSVKLILQTFLQRLQAFPSILYKEYLFVYDFFVHFQVKPKTIERFVGPIK